MKTDDQVLAEATEIVRHQWCQGQYWNGEFGHEARYCAMGAVQKAAGLDLQQMIKDLCNGGITEHPPLPPF